MGLFGKYLGGQEKRVNAIEPGLSAGSPDQPVCRHRGPGVVEWGGISICPECRKPVHV